jgi:predicted transcriptional regulator
MKEKLKNLFPSNTACGKLLVTLNTLENYPLKKTKLSISYLSKKTDLTYAHSFKIITILEEAKLIKLQRVGRWSLLSLTPTGKKFAIKLKEASDFEQEILRGIKWEED